MNHHFFPRILSGALALWLAAMAATQAQTAITSLPYTITAGGLYVLNSNLSSSAASGALITVSASNVTIDFQGHYIAGAVGNTSQSTYGIEAYERSNLTIKNGTVAYCYLGILIYGNGQSTTNNVDQIIDNMRVTYCYYEGIELDDAPSSRITNCQISQIGYSGSGDSEGIYIGGAGVTVQGCDVGNIIADTASDEYCIDSDDGSFSVGNQLSNGGYGVELGIYQNNLAHNCTLPFEDGTDAGGNTSD